MVIFIPSIRNKHGATTADVIAEQIALCKANLLTIEKVAVFRKPREKRDEINRRLRGCHDFMGMAGSRKFGCLYREVGLNSEDSVVCEHAIPVTAMVSLYEAGTPFEELVFFPVARITKTSDQKFGSLGLTKSGYDLERPFLRYHIAGIEIETHFGTKISCKNWSIQDHWKLVDETPELSHIRQEVINKLTAKQWTE
ncbi:hypothetical protein J4377_10220 [Halomonas sp. XH26]|uniref:hypothetical protein n=1 Tax=Halomonas sp. XH26 TaxID=2557993 RepID=UPI00209F763E|nr:hypothetical protein [Halomonas sp. XH26]UTA78361.1 hypothetical protein J4377_10220 [Halomonas sp. XH26]